MSYDFLDKPPLAIPVALGISDRAQDYEMPETPPGLAAAGCPKSVKEVCRLLPNKLIPVFREAVETAVHQDLGHLVSGWAVFAFNLHDPQYQEMAAAISQGKMAEPTAEARPLPPLDPPLSLEEQTLIRQRVSPSRMFVDGHEVVWVEDK